jgi:hypothetical protein
MKTTKIDTSFEIWLRDVSRAGAGGHMRSYRTICNTLKTARMLVASNLAIYDYERWSITKTATTLVEDSAP